jgi:uncharacterized membrane protein YedE/YeeE
MASFDPIAGLAGGALIGLAVVLMMLLNGRIAGVSGVLGGVFSPKAGDVGWRLAFIAGLIAVPLIVRAAGYTLPAVDLPHSVVIVAGGLLVGFGTRLGSGCTSGHGVCGLARLSPRSLVATCGFMGAAALTVAIVRHGFGA